MRLYSYAETKIDFPGKGAVIVFASGCNYKCPACYAKRVIENKEKRQIPNEEIISFLKARKDWYDGIVVCGGEPTIQAGLKNFLQEIRRRLPNLAIKLDTNGSRFAVLNELRKEKLVDYAAMDLKAPARLYNNIAGIEGEFDFRDNVGKGIALVASFPEHEYRTTVFPILEEGKFRWMSVDELAETARMPYEWTGTREHKYYLQKFVARERGIMLDNKFSAENIPPEFRETPASLLEEANRRIKEEGTVSDCRIRGK